MGEEKEELAKRKAEKKAKNSAAQKDAAQPGRKAMKINEKQQSLREEAVRIAAEDGEAVVAKPARAKKTWVETNSARSGVMKKVEKARRQVRDKAMRGLSRGEMLTTKEVKIVKRGVHQIQGEVVKVEKTCNAHIKLLAAGEERNEKTLRAEARDAGKRMVAGDLATAVKWREQGMKPQPTDGFLQTTPFKEELSTDRWLDDKENMAP